MIREADIFDDDILARLAADETITGKWKFKGYPWHDVRAYGAVGDGVTDDTAAIQAAITAAETAGSSVVFPSASAAYISATGGFVLKRSTRIVGGPGAVLKLTSPSATLFKFGSGTVDDWLPGGVENLALAGNGGASDTSIGVQIGNGTASAHGVTLVGCEISGFGNGVVIAGTGDAFGWAIDRCRIRNNAFNGVRIDTSETIETSTLSKTFIFNNGNNQPTGTGIQCSPSAGATLRLIGCNIDNNGDGTLGQIHCPATGVLNLYIDGGTHFEHSGGVDSKHIALLTNSGASRSSLYLSNTEFVQNPTTALNKPILQIASGELHLSNCRLSQKVAAAVTPVIDLGASSSGLVSILLARNNMFAASGTVANAQILAVTGSPTLASIDVSGTVMNNYETATVASIPTGVIGAHDLTRPVGSLEKSGVQTILGGTYNTGHWVLGGYHLWIEAATGKLRIKSGAPTSDSDGTVVGTQT